MSKLTTALSEFDSSDNALSEHNLSARATKFVMRFFSMEPGTLAKVPEFGMSWFYEQHPDFPIRLEVRREKVDISRIFLDTIKTKAWKKYVTILDEYEFGRLGVIMSAHNQRFYVFHNWWNLPQVSGYTRMTRCASSGDSGVIFELLESLLCSIKQRGWSP